MSCPDFNGRTIDGKYQMMRELGRGGMGTVYLATHLGTERPVAVKIIAPQFMKRAEFVERFRREARAAGRLRHPNVVDVTDFGFSDSPDGQVAYLVMEYLDGCTLGEILDEEKNLPVGWTLDILEQVCSAVHEAHQQGIIHRDLKPDNIWLEPNQRGGYTVKVLDFGIAKLEEHGSADAGSGEIRAAEPTLVGSARSTFSGLSGSTFAGDNTTMVSPGGTMAGEGETLAVGGADLEGKTAIYDPATPSELNSVNATANTADDDISDQDTIGTRVLSGDVPSTIAQRTTAKSLLDAPATSGLTRVGAVLGTPLYMSPEQCRGDRLDPRSDIYSLGVIAYQMLSGKTPFEGEFAEVMTAHRESPVPPLAAKSVRRKMRRAIYSALDKDPEKRPQTAEAFASELRSRSEGIFGLLRRALVIYSEHLPKFLALTTFFSLPVILLTLFVIVMSFLRVSDVVDESAAGIAIGAGSLAVSAASIFCTYLIIGTITWIVSQHLAVPLRPIRLRPALREAQSKWKTFAGTGVLSTVLTFVIGILTCGVGFLVVSVLWTLVAPVVMMENVRGRAALRRSKQLVRRSLWTSAGAVAIMFLMPAMIAATISLVVNLGVRAIDPKTPAEKAAVVETIGDDDDSPRNSGEPNLRIRYPGQPAIERGERPDMRTRLRNTVSESLIQIIWMPMQILVLSFSAIIVALLYIKTRLAGGESLNDLVERFEDDGQPRKKWQERVRQRLIQSGRISGRSFSNEVDRL